ncbi:Leucine-rich repeat and IQ domain-containing protein 1, partial [Ophiophagus hannah]
MLSFVAALILITNHNFKIDSHLPKCFDIVHLFRMGSNKGLWDHSEEDCLTELACLFESNTSPVRREDTDLELVSLTSGSTLTQNREKNNQPHRHSAESSSKRLFFSF